MFEKALRVFVVIFVFILLFVLAYYIKEMANLIPQNRAEKRNGAVSGLEGIREIDEIILNDLVFDVEVVTTPEDRRRGLMYRPYLEKMTGMLFVFEEEGYHSFWMKNTLISLDIIWADVDGEIVYIYENAKPCVTNSCSSYVPDSKALYVLELNSGDVLRYGIKLGDKMSFNRL
jgi:uncharacterized protein